MCCNKNDDYVYNQLTKKEIDYLIKNCGYTCLTKPHNRFLKNIKVMVNGKKIHII